MNRNYLQRSRSVREIAAAQDAHPYSLLGDA